MSWDDFVNQARQLKRQGCSSPEIIRILKQHGASESEAKRVLQELQKHGRMNVDPDDF
jgi:SOS response regulatory protein OraA/RecX